MGFKLLQEWKTNFCADSAEWCPLEPYQNYFVCGTYELQNLEDKSTVNKQQVRLDCKWCPKRINNKILLVTANADGKITVWSFEHDEAVRLNLICNYTINHENVLSLSLDLCVEQNDCKICVSDSAGFITILLVNDNLDCMLTNKIKVHDYEAWIVIFNAESTSQILSGADDCLLKITDLKSGKTVTQVTEHTSGVTSIRYNHLKENVLASGSYDESIKLWDIRNTSKSLSTHALDGGIWRIKWNPENSQHILVAGMYSGFFWLDYDTTNDSVVTKDSFKKHESIAYGADINYMSSKIIKGKYFTDDANENSDINHKLTVTCSFYDKKLCLCVV